MSGANATAVYDTAQADAIAAASAAVVAAKDVVLGGHLGREYTAITQDRTVTVRMYLVGDRLYKQDMNSTQPDASDIAAFFDSFQFIGP